MQAIIKVIEKISDLTGRFANSLIIITTILIMFEVISRRFFGQPHVWSYEVIAFFYAMHFMLAGAFTLLYKGHVTVDLIHSRLSTRGKAILDVVGYLLFFFPFLIILIKVGTEFAIASWKISEVTPSAKLPYIVPIMKTLIPFTALLLVLQGLVNIMRNVYIVIKGAKL
ncbi:TRAP transporter small permease subunit [Peptococcaceae bacterium]|nr:TRAP transporter small permease subunit [Peptococcaceae bacterium]MCL0063511.1 TRAP transporter small permease subunit [Peptococcaceae bacterium]